MNREILFRGKRVDNGELVEGSFHYSKLFDKHFILVENANLEDTVEAIYHIVDPSTVGQYTGLLDRNGKRIFEGDVVEYCEARYLTAVVCFGEYNTSGPSTIHSRDYGWHFKTIQVQGIFKTYIDQPVHVWNGRATYFPCSELDTPKSIENSTVKILGNIHDTPELLEAKQ